MLSQKEQKSRNKAAYQISRTVQKKNNDDKYSVVWAKILKDSFNTPNIYTSNAVPCLVNKPIFSRY